MTTVGYGDIAPKSLPSRVFSVIWITTGLTLVSILVGSMATEILDFTSPEIPNLKGLRVGVLENRLFNARICSQHSGVLHEVKFNSTILGVIDLIKKLKNNRVDGFLVTKATYYYFSRSLRKNSKYKNINIHL